MPRRKPYQLDTKRCKVGYKRDVKGGTMCNPKPKAPKAPSIPQLTTKSGKPDMRYRVNKLMYG